MEIDCTVALTSNLLFFFNFIFFLSGLALIIIGAVIRSDYGDYFSYADSRFATAELFIIAIGVIVLLIGFFGCCGAMKANHCMITAFAVSLSLIFILEIVAGIVGYSYRGEVQEVAGTGLKRAVENYKKEEGARHMLDWAQQEFVCCGKDGPVDFDSKHANKTKSICGPPGQGVASCHKGDNCNGTLYNEGCMEKIVDFLGSNMYTIGAFAVGIAFIQLVGISLACCLMKAIKSGYEGVA